MTIAEALNALAEYFSDSFSDWPAVSPRWLGSWVASCAAVGTLLSDEPRPCSRIWRLARALEFRADSTRSSWTGPLLCGELSVAPDDSGGACGVPGARLT